MNFSLRKTAIYQAIKWKHIFRYCSVFKIIFWILFWVLIVWAFFNYFALAKNFTSQEKTFAFAILFFSFAVMSGESKKFFEKKLKNPSLRYSLKQALQNPSEYNFAGFLTFEAARACLKAIKSSKQNKEASLKDILLLVLATSKSLDIGFVFNRAGLNKKDLKNFSLGELNKVKGEKEISFEEVITKAGKMAIEGGRERITTGDLLCALAEKDPVFGRFLVEVDLKSSDIKNLVDWFYKQKIRQENLKCWWSYTNLLTRGSLGRDFSSGYTITLDKFSFDWQDKIAKNIFREIVGHIDEIKQVERILEKETNKNVLIVGEPGVGRGSIIEAIAQKAFLGNSVSSVNHKRIVQFDISALKSTTKSPQEAESILEKCFAEAVKAKNVILVINDFHNYIANISQPGMINIAAIMGRYLPLKHFQVIGVTSFDGWHTSIERNSSFSNLFEKVEAMEISENDTLILMEQFVPFFEAKNKKYISFKALKEILKMSSRYMAQSAFPEKALRLLDEAIVYLKMYTKDSVLRREHIRRVVSEKVKIPLDDLESKEKQKLLNLEDLIHTRLINQTEAVSEVASALRRARSEVNLKAGPIGSFLFLGPTGVGKTETAKALAEIYFGSEQNMVRFDMSEFQTTEDIKRLIGTSQENGLLTTKIKEKPFCLLLLDELEKAHPNILTLFLQVLDEGWLTDGLGRKVDFKNTIIIATSNVASEIIIEDVKIGESLDNTKNRVFNYAFEKRLLKPEFVNRFDAVVLFKPLGKPELLQIAGLMLNKLSKSLLDKGVKLEITQELKEKIVELSYNPAFGAREMKRIMQDKVENSLAKSLLLGDLGRGKIVSIVPEDFSLKIT